VESGLLSTPVALTSSQQVGLVRDAILKYTDARGLTGSAGLPVVAETWDGWLSDPRAHALTAEHVFAALDGAQGGPVAEGNVGAGTGIHCHEFKAGIGTASRQVTTKAGAYTVGALAQTNQGDRRLLRVDGVPVGREIPSSVVPTPWDEPPDSAPLSKPDSAPSKKPDGGSIIVVLATDAPLLPGQCRRLAQRATIGLARTGGLGDNGSGDLFLAFATANHLAPESDLPYAVLMLPQEQMDPLFEAAAEAVEEAILNSLTAGETMTGREGRTGRALPLDLLTQAMARYRRRDDPAG
jgi:D-aminopeptidase